LAEVAVQLALKERHPRDWKRFRHDGQSQRRVHRLLLEATAAWTEVAESLGAVCVDVGDVADRARDLLSSYGLASYDAVHVATALGAGVSDFVSIDADFAYVPENLLTVWVDRSRVAACRKRRT
jgi:predicted nucleic acid-binding protein